MIRCGLLLAPILGWSAVFTPLSPAAAETRDYLWQIVGGLCLTDQQSLGLAFPCKFVDFNRGFALIDAARSHFLLVPIRRIEGIEDPEVLVAGAPNYWQYAWEQRIQLSKTAGAAVPRDDVAMAVNSRQGRTQDQLHIHIGCIRPDIKFALRIYEPKINETWSRLPFALDGYRYRIMRINGDELGAANPFVLVAKGIPGAAADMASETIVVVGAAYRSGGNGFYVLASRGDEHVAANGGNLLDYNCSVLSSWPLASR